MAQAIVDPEQLRQFALMLKRFNTTLSESSTKLQAELGKLSASWRDQQHQKFATEFEDQLKQLRRSIAAGEQHVSYLMRKAELIEEYQRGG